MELISQQKANLLTKQKLVDYYNQTAKKIKNRFNSSDPHKGIV